MVLIDVCVQENLLVVARDCSVSVFREHVAEDEECRYTQTIAVFTVASLVTGVFLRLVPGLGPLVVIVRDLDVEYLWVTTTIWNSKVVSPTVVVPLTTLSAHERCIGLAPLHDTPPRLCLFTENDAFVTDRIVDAHKTIQLSKKAVVETTEFGAIKNLVRESVDVTTALHWQPQSNTILLVKRRTYRTDCLLGEFASIDSPFDTLSLTLSKTHTLTHYLAHCGLFVCRHSLGPSLCAVGGVGYATLATAHSLAHVLQVPCGGVSIVSKSA
jgi:hypothetical protein